MEKKNFFSLLHSLHYITVSPERFVNSLQVGQLFTGEKILFENLWLSI